MPQSSGVPPASGVILEPFAVSLPHIALALAAAAIIAAAAHRKRLLDSGGAVAATVLGPVLVAAGGWWLGAILIAFFVSAGLLPSPAGESPSRTWQQVVANGGPALTFAAVSLIGGREPMMVGAVATIAATTSDTWATEIGRTYGGTPLSVRTGTRVPPGTSGAVTLAGMAASVAGAALIAALAILLAPIAPVDIPDGAATALIIATCGVLGSSVDTVLGATVQARFRCAVCGKISETGSDHLPGHQMRLASGNQFMSNSMVNLCAAMVAGLAGALLARLTL